MRCKRLRSEPPGRFGAFGHFGRFGCIEVMTGLRNNAAARDVTPGGRRLLVCSRCGGALAGTSRRPKRSRPGFAPFYVCTNYTHRGRGVCVRNEVKEAWAVRQVIAELRERLLLPERLEWLRGELQARARARQADSSLARMRKAVAALEGTRARCRKRLVEASADMLPEVEAQIRQVRGQLDAARQSLHDVETADPVRDLAVTVGAAQKALWSLERALEGDNRCRLKEALAGILSAVLIEAEPHSTKTGKTRHRPRIQGIRLRPGSGLDVLSILSTSPGARPR